MSVLKRGTALLSFALALLTFSSANAAITLQMNLEQMVTYSERVFVGEVVEISETRVAAGGGELPAVTYRIRVTDTFKGDYETVKDEQFTEVTMVGSLKDVMAGRHPITDFPVLSVGTEYLLFVAEPGPTGLTATMGLGQGCFHLNGTDADRVAMNLVNNAGLFNGMTVPFSQGEPILYSELADLINDIVGGAE
ncbi:MAG: hypothetical protein QNI99_02745 [Woeseiaceae bacterium]|nr:hypothetical protein [Woeseiaceae bacterium]